MDPRISIIQSGNVPELDRLLKSNQLSKEDKEQGLLYATSIHQYAIVRRLLDQINIDYIDSIYPYTDLYQSIFIAADSGDVDMIDVFFDDNTHLSNSVVVLLVLLMAQYQKSTKLAKTNIYKVFDHILKKYIPHSLTTDRFEGLRLLENAIDSDARALFARLLLEPIDTDIKFEALGKIREVIRPHNLKTFVGTRSGKYFMTISKTWQRVAMAIYDPYFEDKSKLLQSEHFADRYPDLNFDDAFTDAPVEVLDDWEKAVKYLEDMVAAELAPGTDKSKKIIDDLDYQTGQINEQCYNTPYPKLIEEARLKIKNATMMQLCIWIDLFKERINLEGPCDEYKTGDLTDVLFQLIQVLTKKDLCKINSVLI